MINFINNKSEEFNILIKKEIENIFTDEYNKNIKKLSNLLNEFNFNNDENKFNDIFIIFNNSILNIKENIEYKIDLKNKLNEDKIIKKANIKKEKEIEYQIEKINIILGEYVNEKKPNIKGKEFDYYSKLLFEGEYLNGKRNGKGKEYYNGNLEYEGEYLNGERYNKFKFDKFTY